MQNFSVLMSVYGKDNPSWLREALRSVLDQTVPPAEILLMEDGPLPDALEAVVKDFEARESVLRVVRFPRNRGLGAVLNDGLRACKYELVARMDSDDISLPDRFEKQLKVFEAYPDIDLVTAWLEEFEDDPARVLCVKRLPETPGELYAFGRRRCPVNHPVTMFRRRAVIESGGYLSYPMIEDYYLWVRMLVAGCRFYCLQESLLRFRVSRAMYGRRGGWAYAVKEVHLLCFMFGTNYITLGDLLWNVFVRIPVRLLPSGLRGWMYRTLARK